MRSPVRRRALALLSVVIVVVAAACSSGSPAPAPTSPATPQQNPPSPPTGSQGAPGSLVRTFTDPDARFTIEYPKRWSIREDVAGTVVAFLAPGDGSENLVDNANITQEDVGEQTLEEYNQSARSQIYAAFPNAVMVAEGPTTMGGADAFRYEYTSAQGDANLHVVQTFSVLGGHLTAMTFVAAEDRWSDRSPTFEAMADSFIYTTGGGSPAP